MTRHNFRKSFHPPKMQLLVFWEKVWLIVLLWGEKKKQQKTSCGVPAIQKHMLITRGGLGPYCERFCETCFCLVLTSGRLLFGLNTRVCWLHDKRSLTVIYVLMVCVEFFKEQPACLRHWLLPSCSLCCANADWQLFLECCLRFFRTTTGRLKASPSVSLGIFFY